MQELERKINLRLKSPGPIDTAFVHKSYLNECKDPAVKDNERMEFLGDAVLELAATHYLYENYREMPEGEMTALRSALVKGNHLAEIAGELELGKYLKLSRGEEKSGGRTKSYILANTLEAFIGAIYLEHGYMAAENFIENFILVRLDEIMNSKAHIDAKSLFQEKSQEIFEITPHYEVLAEEGPDHDKHFKMGAFIGHDLIAEGEGSSKQKAEDAAARKALKAKNWHK